ncbi:hypothetical protein [Phorcysia thermohydrogeniphila]|uniref:Lipoprotein n=1 Tax=Phorcysia thermohydrogeniphila TaxID=936138 RepID=A0A4R1G7H3_9BACT|nr:hypothetical protein [Phorcysia thermohydrogeniphila]TCK04027.1 hypothetical protein CLV27_1344 [Phorcysia thermohydrogeniphila]
MKRWKSLFLIVFLLSSLTSCGDNKEEKNKESPIYSQIQELTNAGILPELDTSEDVKGKEIDGIREDVFKEVEKRYKEELKDKEELYRALLLGAWTAQRIFDIDPTVREQAVKYSILIELEVSCVGDAYDSYMIPYLENKYGRSFPEVLDIKEADEEYAEGLLRVYDIERYIRAITYNTVERAKYYHRLNLSLDGTVSSNIGSRVHNLGFSSCDLLKEMKKEWENGKNILEIDIDELLNRMVERRKES